MNSTEVIENINESVKQYSVMTLVKDDLKTHLKNYDLMFKEYKLLTTEQADKIFEEVKEKRPVIGKKLKAEFDALITTI